MLLWSPPRRVRPVGFAIDLHGLGGRLFVPLAPLASLGVLVPGAGSPRFLERLSSREGAVCRAPPKKKSNPAADARPRLCYIRDDGKVAAGKPRGAFGTRSFSIHTKTAH